MAPLTNALHLAVSTLVNGVDALGATGSLLPVGPSLKGFLTESCQ